jgi:hypothetical protein
MPVMRIVVLADVATTAGSRTATGTFERFVMDVLRAMVTLEVLLGEVNLGWSEDGKR